MRARMTAQPVKLLPICRKEADELNVSSVCGGVANVGLIGYLATVELTKEGKARMFCISPIGGKMNSCIGIAAVKKKIEEALIEG